MTEIGTFWVVADQYEKIVHSTWRSAIEETYGRDAGAVILRCSPADGVQDWTKFLAVTWLEELSEVDDAPPEAFAKYVGDAVIERRQRSEDPYGVLDLADAQYNEMMGK